MSKVCHECCPDGLDAGDPVYWCPHGKIVSQAAAQRITERDAARYRWLRERARQTKGCDPGNWTMDLYIGGDTFDAAVDSAMVANPPKTG